MYRLVQSLYLGVAIAVLGVFIYTLPVGQAWEEANGLAVFFQLRGQRPVPPEVAVVAIDTRSSEQLGLERDMRDWPRSLYARLTNRLVSAGAAVIVFDIYFRNPGIEAYDLQFSSAIERAGNVLLFGYLEREILDNADGGDLLEVERLQPPIEQFANQAIAIAPFVLPKVPVRVSRFWTFYGANDLVSLPAAALEQYTAPVWPVLSALIGDSISEPSATNTAIRNRLRADPVLTRRLLERVSSGQVDLEADQRRRLSALLALYLPVDYPYLNFYGPARSVTTLSLQTVLSDPIERLAVLRDKVVFVGFSERKQPGQKDNFYTIFSKPNGLDISGVEIAATAFANLLQRDTFKPPGGTALLVVFFWGMLISVLFRALPAYWNVGIGLFAAGLYFLIVYQLFVQANFWMPWTVPLLVQSPLALFAALLWHYRDAHRSHRQLRDIFGYYLPGDVIDRLAQDTRQALSQNEAAFGVCMATDAEQYTRLAEQMKPVDLQKFMNRYYEVLFAPVRRRGGMISDVVGDAMMAVWSAPGDDVMLRQKACEAALDIVVALEQAWQMPVLPTRIGLHAGAMVLSHIGAVDHFEYRAVGDIVNAASRIENFNKLLGTSVLASQQTVEGLDNLVTRPLGVFTLRGKQQALELCELVCRSAELSDDVRQLHDDFSEALATYQTNDRDAAAIQFRDILCRYPDDGPSRYYLTCCDNRQNYA